MIIKLCSAGFAYSDVLEFSLDQIKLFLGLIEKQAANEKATTLQLTAIAAQGSSESIKKAVQSLESVNNGKK